MRRQFDLPEVDVEYLDAMRLPWEAIVDGAAQWVLVHEYPLPTGYTHATTTVAIRITPGYPTAGLDMASFDPPVTRRDGRAMDRAITSSIEGKIWQQWSRHYTGQNPWRAGEDSLGSHLRLVDNWLERELLKR